jgi:sugar/nucleoside kinase (ribokinase family)
VTAGLPGLTYVVLGDVMTDVVCLLRGPLVPGSDSPAPVRVSGGGSAANTSAWLAATGQQAVYVGRVGADLAGEVAVAALTAGGVEVRAAVDGDLPTGTCVVLVGVDGERTMIPDSGANARWSLEDVPLDVWGPSSHLHVSGYALLNPGARLAALEAIRLARESGATVSVDPASVCPLAEVGAAEFLSWVAGVDLVLANAEEASVLTGCADPAEAAHELTAVFATVVVKLGADGALLFRRGSSEVVRRSVATVEVVDSTGAGDAFAAGFLPVWRAGGDEAEALDAGNALGAEAVRIAGARP